MTSLYIISFSVELYRNDSNNYLAFFLLHVLVQHFSLNTNNTGKDGAEPNGDDPGNRNHKDSGSGQAEAPVASGQVSKEAPEAPRKRRFEEAPPPVSRVNGGTSRTEQPGPAPVPPPAAAMGKWESLSVSSIHGEGGPMSWSKNSSDDSAGEGSEGKESKDVFAQPTLRPREIMPPPSIPGRVKSNVD